MKRKTKFSKFGRRMAAAALTAALALSLCACNSGTGDKPSQESGSGSGEGDGFLMTYELAKQMNKEKFGVEVAEVTGSDTAENKYWEDGFIRMNDPQNEDVKDTSQFYNIVHNLEITKSDGQTYNIYGMFQVPLTFNPQWLENPEGRTFPVAIECHGYNTNSNGYLSAHWANTWCEPESGRIFIMGANIGPDYIKDCYEWGKYDEAIGAITIYDMIKGYSNSVLIVTGSADTTVDPSWSYNAINQLTSPYGDTQSTLVLVSNALHAFDMMDTTPVKQKLMAYEALGNYLELNNLVPEQK